MLKVYDSAVVFTEFPDEITLAINISQCPGYCDGCSEPWLLEDIGDELTEEKIQELLDSHKDCTVFGFMGGDNDHNDVIRIAKYVKEHSNMKIGIYSGFEFINTDLIPYIDYYKIGRWIMPKGEVEDWHKVNCGPLNFPWSNQLLFEKKGNKLVNITYKFRTSPLGNPERYIIRDSKETD